MCPNYRLYFYWKQRTLPCVDQYCASLIPRVIKLWLFLHSIALGCAISDRLDYFLPHCMAYLGLYQRHGTHAVRFLDVWPLILLIQFMVQNNPHILPGWSHVLPCYIHGKFNEHTHLLCKFHSISPTTPIWFTQLWSSWRSKIWKPSVLLSASWSLRPWFHG